MEFSEQVLVLKVGKFREADAWVRFFSPTRGLLTAFAFGGCKSRRRFCGCLDALNQVHFRVRSNRRGDYLCLMEGTLLRSPTRLRSDNARLGLMANCVKFVEAAMRGIEGAESIYALLIEALDALDSEAGATPAFPLLFRAKLLDVLGYGPDMGRCSLCGAAIPESASPRFLVAEGRVVCERCRQRAQGHGVTLSPGALKTLSFVRDNGPGRWQRLALDGPVKRELSEMVDGFVTYHLGLAWDRGFFHRV